MSDEEIEEYRKRLNELTAECSDSNPESRRLEDLKKLTREVGASTCALSTGDADTSEIIRNIHQALQTASMVNMCKRATQGYEIATQAIKSASKQFRIMAIIALLSAAAAFTSAAVAWVKVVWA